MDTLSRYGDWYEHHAPFDECCQLMDYMDPNHEGVQKPVDLLEYLKRDNGRTPLNFVYLDNKTGLLEHVHRPLYFDGISRHNANWENSLLAFTGDARRTQTPHVVKIPENFLDVDKKPLRVPLWATAVAWSSTEAANDHFLPEVPEGAPDNEFATVLLRKAMWVPPGLAGVFMDKAVLPSKAIPAVAAAIAANDEGADADDYDAFLWWLTAAAMESGANRLARQALTGPGGNAKFTDTIEGQVKRDLRGWGRSTTQVPGGTQFTTPQSQAQFIADFLQQHSTLQQAQGPPVDPTPKTKLPSDRWPVQLDRILRLTGCATEASLPAVWHDMAQVTHRDVRGVVEQICQKVATTTKLWCPVITANLSRKIANVEFAMGDTENLDGGLHPFAVTYRDKASVAAQMQLNQVHDQVNQGVMAGLADIQAMHRADKAFLPLTNIQCNRTLQAFGLILAVVCGTTSVVYKDYRKYFIDDWSAVEESLQNQAAADPWAFAKYLRWIQLEIAAYWEAADNHGDYSSTADFAALHKAIKRRNNNWIPELPPQYLPKSSGTPTGATPAAAGTGGGAPAPPTSARKYVKNPKPVEALVAVGTKLGRITGALKKANFTFDQVPTHTNGTQPCLSWHLKGGCYNDCTRTAQHVSLSKSEEGRLLAFFKQCVDATPTAASDGAGQQE